MKNLRYLFRELFALVKAHKLYVITPLVIVLALISLLIYQYGPAVIISFIYAGI
jgi:hypothetical protein